MCFWCFSSNLSISMCNLICIDTYFCLGCLFHMCFMCFIYVSQMFHICFIHVSFMFHIIYIYIFHIRVIFHRYVIDVLYMFHICFTYYVFIYDIYLCTMICIFFLCISGIWYLIFRSPTEKSSWIKIIININMHANCHVNYTNQNITSSQT